MMLANEVQVMLAELRGKSIGSLDIYEARLAAVDPWKLYRSALVELRERMADFEVQAVDPCATLRDYIRAEIVVLKNLGRWRRDPPKIGSLLLPPRTITDASSSD
jgi:hypothetical protein